jgi:hypothetical protein
MIMVSISVSDLGLVLVHLDGFGPSKDSITRATSTTASQPTIRRSRSSGRSSSPCSMDRDRSQTGW